MRSKKLFALNVKNCKILNEFILDFCITISENFAIIALSFVKFGFFFFLKKMGTRKPKKLSVFPNKFRTLLMLTMFLQNTIQLCKINFVKLDKICRWIANTWLLLLWYMLIIHTFLLIVHWLLSWRNFYWKIC